MYITLVFRVGALRYLDLGASNFVMIILSSPRVGDDAVNNNDRR